MVCLCLDFWFFFNVEDLSGFLVIVKRSEVLIGEVEEGGFNFSFFLFYNV